MAEETNNTQVEDGETGATGNDAGEGESASMAEMLAAMSVEIDEKGEAGEETPSGEGEGEETPPAGEGEETPPADDEEPAPGEEDTLSRALTLIEQLNSKIEALETKMTAEPPADTPPPPPPPEEWQAMDFIDEDFDIDTLTRESFNEMLNSVAAKVFTLAKESAATNVLLKVPDIVRNNVQIQNSITKALDKFYSDNSDLKEHSKVVMAEAEKIATAEPNLGVNELFVKAGEAARKTLKLTKAAQPPPKPTTRAGRAGLTSVNKQGTPSDDDNLSKFDKEVDAMLKAINTV